MDKSEDVFSLGENAENKLFLAELAKILNEILVEDRLLPWEPFEIYENQLKAHLQADTRTFRRRLMRGYEVLLQTLAQNES